MRGIPIILIFIFLLSLFIRLYRLNSFPLGFHVDEAKVAWEAYSILKTGRDDHGNLLSLYYNSFGDFRPTGIFYTAIPSLIIFGRTNFAVRFPSAILGALTVIPIYFITLEITKNRKVALISSFFLSIIPWDITTSRATSEVVISAFFILSSLALLKSRLRLSFILLAFSFLFYHSARIVGPILMLIWIIYLWENLVEHKKVLYGFLITGLFAGLLVLSPTGLARYNQVKLPTFDIRSITVNYFSYFDPNFLVGNIAKPFRYTTANNGIVSLPFFILFLVGIYIILSKNHGKILLLYLAVGPLPATLTLEDSPNLHRSFFMVPFLVIIAAIGFHFFLEKHSFWAKVFILGIIFSFISFTSNYLDSNNNFAFGYRDPQTKRLSAYIEDNQKKYSRIYVTNEPDSPYPWYAFFNNIEPSIINPDLEKQQDGKWVFQNIVWSNTRCPAGAAFYEAKKDKTLTKIMVVDNGACATDFKKDHPEAEIIKEFDYNGKVNYRVWEYQATRF